MYNLYKPIDFEHFFKHVFQTCVQTTLPLEVADLEENKTADHMKLNTGNKIYI